MRRPFSTYTLPLASISKEAVSPRRRSGISSICSLLSRISKTTFSKNRSRDLLSGVIQRAQDGSRQLTTTVDTNEQVVFRVEFEVSKGTAVRDDTCVIQNLTGGVGLTVTVKKTPGLRCS